MIYLPVEVMMSFLLMSCFLLLIPVSSTSVLDSVLEGLVRDVLLGDVCISSVTPAAGILDDAGLEATGVSLYQCNDEELNMM